MHESVTTIIVNNAKMNEYSQTTFRMEQLDLPSYTVT
jgi:hypothetical protein